MIDLPLIVFSPKIEFIIAGTMGRFDGILAVSNENVLQSVFFEYCYAVYNKKLNIHPYKQKQFNSLHHIWSPEMNFIFEELSLDESVIVNSDNRSFKILTCWQFKSNSKPSLISDVENFFTVKAFDLFKIIMDEKLTNKTKENLLSWELSQLNTYVANT